MAMNCLTQLIATNPTLHAWPVCIGGHANFIVSFQIRLTTKENTEPASHEAEPFCQLKLDDGATFYGRVEGLQGPLRQISLDFSPH